MELIFPRPLWDDLHNHMLGPSALAHGVETLAFLFTAPNMGSSRTAMTVRHVLKPTEHEYDARSRVGIRPTADYVASVLTECRQNNLGLVEVHTHPFDSSESTTFSGIDWANDRSKMPQLAGFMPSSFQHATMVMGRASFDAHYYDKSTSSIVPIRRLKVIGGPREQPVVAELTPTGAQVANADEPRTLAQHQRHADFLAIGGQDRLSQSRVGVVGVGGIGSFIALELAHLGVGALVLVDPDQVELTNLNRLIGAGPSDVGKPKTAVFADQIRRVSDGAIDVIGISESVESMGSVDALKQCDLILGCLDNHGARLLLNQLAVQYSIPLIDAGVGISVGSGLRFGGQVQLVASGRGCLLCRGFIDARRAAFDLATPTQQAYERSHGYGASEAAPSVISLNGVVGSIQVSMALRLIAQDGVAPDMVVYDGERSKMFAAQVEGMRDCAVCGRDGVTGYGDLLAIQRQNAANPDPIPAAPQ